MTKTSIKKLLKSAAGGAEFITRGDIKKAFRCGNDRAEEITDGLDYICFGRTRHFDVDEVAQKVFESMEKVAV